MEIKSIIKLNYDQSQLTLMKKMKYLLNAGADINEQDSNDNFKSAIFKTIDYGYLNTFKFLLANGADLNINNGNLQNILHYAIEKVNPQFVKYILLNCLEKFDINAKNENGDNPILMSYKDYIFFDKKNKNQLEILNLLLKYSDFKINLKEKDKNGKNILDILNKINDTEIIELILNYEDHLYLNPEEIIQKRKEEANRKIKENTMPIDIEDEFMFV